MTDEDIANLRTLQRLVLLLSQPRSQGSSNVDTQVVTTQIVLPSRLPQDVQQRLLRVPGDLVCRAAARTLRRLFM
ncbi:hypothetical protein LIER_20204 [Lithospermum erythrorhizon]|uniref:Uncharacterized protein n=1 Tax=Lithospermum erythrorhizon TaxID=34254 RepID=A0AAV3QM47_LITER